MSKGFSLVSGLLMGLSALSLLGSSRYIPTYGANDGMRGDWLAVGRDLKDAVRRAGELVQS